MNVSDLIPVGWDASTIFGGVAGFLGDPLISFALTLCVALAIAPRVFGLVKRLSAGSGDRQNDLYESGHLHFLQTSGNYKTKRGHSATRVYGGQYNVYSGSQKVGYSGRKRPKRV